MQMHRTSGQVDEGRAGRILTHLTPLVIGRQRCSSCPRCMLLSIATIEATA
jgi:hypothetical protein